jgi:hypothetical protein
LTGAGVGLDTCFFLLISGTSFGFVSTALVIFGGGDGDLVRSIGAGG